MVHSVRVKMMVSGQTPPLQFSQSLAALLIGQNSRPCLWLCGVPHFWTLWDFYWLGLLVCHLEDYRLESLMQVLLVISLCSHETLWNHAADCLHCPDCHYTRHGHTSSSTDWSQRPSCFWCTGGHSMSNLWFLPEVPPIAWREPHHKALSTLASWQVDSVGPLGHSSKKVPSHCWHFLIWWCFSLTSQLWPYHGGLETYLCCFSFPDQLPRHHFPDSDAPLSQIPLSQIFGVFGGAFHVPCHPQAQRGLGKDRTTGWLVLIQSCWW